MLGVLITFAFCLGAVGLGHGYLRKLLVDEDPALRFGLSGLIGLAGIGLMTLAIGLLPGGLTWGLYAVGAFALLGLGLLARDRMALFGPPTAPSKAEWAFVA